MPLEWHGEVDLVNCKASTKHIYKDRLKFIGGICRNLLLDLRETDQEMIDHLPFISRGKYTLS